MIELVTQDSSECVVAEKMPALIGQTGIYQSEAVPGRYNCLISQVDDHFVVWDLGGGMFVNGAPASKATLGAGDTLRFGGTEFKVKQPERPAGRYRFGVRT